MVRRNNINWIIFLNVKILVEGDCFMHIKIHEYLGPIVRHIIDLASVHCMTTQVMMARFILSINMTT